MPDLVDPQRIHVPDPRVVGPDEQDEPLYFGKECLPLLTGIHDPLF
jgi:hypothetical protein